MYKYTYIYKFTASEMPFFKAIQRMQKVQKRETLSVSPYTAAGNLITAKLCMSYWSVLSVLISQLCRFINFV